MKSFISFVILFVLMPLFSFAESLINTTFPQDVADIYTTKEGLLDNKVVNIDIEENDKPVAVTKSGTVQFDGQDWTVFKKKLVVKDENIHIDIPDSIQDILDIASRNGSFAIGSKKGLYLYDQDNKKWQQALPADENYSWALRNVNAVVFDSKGRLWFGADQGAGYLEDGEWHLFTGKEGLPYNKFTCAVAGQNGIVWFGTENGAIRTDGTQFYYRSSRRWLPDNYVNDIAVQKDGTAWIATNGGVSRISPIPMTLEKKASLFTEQVETRHNRMGFIAQNHLKEQFNIDSREYAISDNDGMYTAMYGAAQAFRYAVTGDKQAKELANRCFKSCKWLVDITHDSGFPARVIIPIDWHEPVNEQYGKEYNERKRKGDPFWKLILPRFVKSKDGKYLWKCDTSSDELAGHYFFYGIYYDLVAETKEEKQMVRDVVRDVTDHLIRNGFLLVDHDGKPTRWGNFSPEFLNSIWGWDQRGLNSMMMLSFLNVAEHVTGDCKYAESAKMLRERHSYHINAMEAKSYFPPENVVPWDNNLCLMSMYGLMNYEKDPELMLMYRTSLEHAWLHISRQKNAFWNILYAALTKRFKQVAESGIYDTGTVFPKAGPFATYTARQLENAEIPHDDILETLYRLPLDLIGYSMDNTHRLDVIFDPTPGQRPIIGWHFDGGALPIDERGHVRQDRDAFALLYSEGNGYSEHEGTFYLLPYYMARYHGMIE